MLWVLYFGFIAVLAESVSNCCNSDKGFEGGNLACYFNKLNYKFKLSVASFLAALFGDLSGIHTFGHDLGNC